MPSQEGDTEILSTAARLRREVGEGFTMERLASEMGLSRATLYRRVGGKDALLARLAGDGERPADLRSRILHAAFAVFSRGSLLGSTVEQVAEEAGVGVATVYRHFGDKDRLVRATLEHATPRRLLRDLSLTPTADVRGDLRAVVRAALPALTGLRGLLGLSLFGSAAERAYLERVRQGTDRAVDLLAAYLAAQAGAGRLRLPGEDLPGEPRELALALLGLVFSFGVLGPARFGTVPDPDHAADLIVTVFLDGVRGREGGHP